MPSGKIACIFFALLTKIVNNRLGSYDPGQQFSLVFLEYAKESCSVYCIGEIFLFKRRKKYYMQNDWLSPMLLY